MTPRRVALQLTPLLDLLLIVIFAQYLDVGERDRQRVASVAELEQRTTEAKLFATRALEQMEQAEADAQAARSQLAVATTALRRSQETERTLATAAASLFEIDPQRLEAALNPFQNPAAPATDAEREAIRNRLKEITSGDADAVVFHLLTHEELRKRVDLWRFHVDEQGVGELEAAGRTQTFRVQPATLLRDVGQYADTLPEPKRLVVVLFTYDMNAREITVEAIRDRLPRLMVRLSENSDSRFDYADLGFAKPGGGFQMPSNIGGASGALLPGN